MNTARISPCGRFVAATTGKDPQLHILKAEPELDSIHVGDFHRQPINCIAWSKSGPYVATGGEDCTVIIWHVSDTELIPKRVFNGHIAAVTALCFHPRGTLVASGGIDEYVYLWDVVNKVMYKRLFANSEPIAAVEFSYDGVMLMVASYDGLVRIWNVQDGMALRTIYESPVTGTFISGAKLTFNSVYVFILYGDGYLRLVSLESAKVVKSFRFDYQNKTRREAREIAFFGENSLVVGTSSGVVKYDLQSGNSELLNNLETFSVDSNLRLGVCVCAGPGGMALFKFDPPKVNRIDLS